MIFCFITYHYCFVSGLNKKIKTLEDVLSNEVKNLNEKINYLNADFKFLNADFKFLKDSLDFKSFEEFSKEQFEKLKQECYLRLNKQFIELNIKLDDENGKTNSDIHKYMLEFDQKLAEAFEAACDKIKFDEIEYKKTITKKKPKIYHYNRIFSFY